MPIPRHVSPNTGWASLKQVLEARAVPGAGPRYRPRGHPYMSEHPSEWKQDSFLKRFGKVWCELHRVWERADDPFDFPVSQSWREMYGK